MRPNKNDITMRIPGGWYGNDPGTWEHNPNSGNITVDPEKLMDAIAWLKKRATIIRTHTMSDGGILLSYDLK